MRATLFFLSKASIPLARLATTSSLRAIMVARSRATPSTLTPWTARSWPASSYLWLDSSRAFDGMQPTRRQVPPSFDSFSTTAAESPAWAARIAATYPPGPPPITIASCIAMIW